jgi:uncharacterized membrane protein
VTVRPLELALLLLLATLWGASFTFIKIGVETLPPLTLIAGRTSIAAVVLLAILRYRHIALPADRAVWRQFLFQACLNSVFPFTLIAWAEKSVDAGLATILNSTSPIFTFLLTWVIAGRQHATAGKLFGVVSGMVGICLIVGVGALSGLRRAVNSRARDRRGDDLLRGGRFVRAQLRAPGSDAAGSGLDAGGRRRAHSGEPAGRSAVDARPIAPFHRRSPRPLDPVERLRLHDLFQAAANAGTRRHDGASLSSGPDRHCNRRRVSRRKRAPTTWIGSILVVAGVFAMTLPGKKR